MSEPPSRSSDAKRSGNAGPAPGPGGGASVPTIVVLPDPAREDPTVPSVRRREHFTASMSSGGFPGPDAPTPVEPSRARWRKRKSRRVAVVLSLAVLGGLAGLLFADWGRKAPGLGSPRASASTPPAVDATESPPAPVQHSARPVAEAPRAAPSASARPQASGESKTGRKPASRDGLWFPPE